MKTLLLLGLLVFVALAGCSSEDSKPSDPFIGAWVYESGAGTYSCDSGETGTITVNAGTHSNFEYVGEKLVANPSSGCSFEVEMSDDSVVPNQNSKCVVNKSHPIYGNYTVTTTYLTGATEWTIDELGHLHETSHQLHVQYYPEYDNYTLTCDVTIHATAERGTP